MTTATPSVTRRSIASVNPYNNEVLAEFPAMTDEEAGRAVAAVHQAFQEWRSLAPAERAAVVGRAASLMRERREELARTVTLEMGKLIGESRGEVDLTRATARSRRSRWSGCSTTPARRPASTSTCSCRRREWAL